VSCSVAFYLDDCRRKDSRKGYSLANRKILPDSIIIFDSVNGLHRREEKIAGMYAFGEVRPL
jgi:hypothetical protein